MDAKNIEPRPNLGDFSNSNLEYIMGVAKVGKRVIFLLDIEKIFNTGDLSAADNSQPN